ncbi:MAG: biopolymer transporter ExbD [Paludibacteraceae bacterium]|jgi:biopolymer transport protein ExbD|nr:biopolymer transporter ExbD [Paludibacteraceae bacterium]MBN2787477.1 biopolymer transporter ExbD [Paludibacteraceae bacterium]
MAKIRKDEKKGVPAISTASLPDIIFMLLFFFMATTSMKEVTYMVRFSVPEATELTKLEKKTLVRYIYVGEPRMDLIKTHGTESRIQIDDEFVDVNNIDQTITLERESMNEADQPKLIVSIKADKETKMGIITDIKQELRDAYALKISYAAVSKVND